MRDERARQASWRALRIRLHPWIWRALPGLCVLLFFALVLTGSNPLGGAGRAVLLLGAVSPLLYRLVQGGTTTLVRGLHGGLVAAVLVIALVLRLQGVTFGLPYFEQPDEWNTADRAIVMVQTANYVPPMFTYPPLYTYLQVGAVALHYLWGASAGLYQQVSDIQPAFFYPWGRALTALLGTGCVLLIYLLARRLYGREVALLAAVALAVYPPHVRDSHYATTDIPLSFFTILALLSCSALLRVPSLSLRERNAQRSLFWLRIRQILLAGVAVGLAAATKYTVAALLVPLIFVACYAAYKDETSLERRFLRALGLVALAFAGVLVGWTLGNPFWLAALPQMLNDIGRILINYKVSEPQYQWSFYWGIARQDALLLTWLGLAGVIFAAVRRRPGDVLLLSFALPYFVQIANVPVVFFRNAQPIVPLLFVFAALPVVGLLHLLDDNAQGESSSSKGDGTKDYRPLSAVRRLSKQRRSLLGVALAAILLAALLYPAQTSLSQSYAMAQPTTRARTTDWVYANVPQGSRIWLEDQTLILPADRYRVGGGKPIGRQKVEWYAERGYNYLVANVSRTPEKNRDALRELIAQAGVTFKSSTTSLGEEFAVIDVARLVDGRSAAVQINAPFGSPIVLEAYQHPEEVKAGRVLPLALFWRCVQPVGPNYTVYVHLIDAAGNKLAQRDVPPLDGTRPTPTWRVGETLRDDQDLPIPADVPPGEYRIEVGMYLPDTFARLNEQPVYLGTVVVTQ